MERTITLGFSKRGVRVITNVTKMAELGDTHDSCLFILYDLILLIIEVRMYIDYVCGSSGAM